jgi:hypothetical protein
MDAGTTLSQLAGSGDHSDVGDDEIAKHFEEKEWPTQLLSIRSQITKTTLDTKCEEYQALSDQKKTKLRNWKIVEWFRKANTRVIKALRDHLLPKKTEKGGPKTAQLRQLFMTAQMMAIVDGEHTEINLETAECIWKMPVVKLWADILALFEGRDYSHIVSSIKQQSKNRASGGYSQSNFKQNHGLEAETEPSACLFHNPHAKKSIPTLSLESSLYFTELARVRALLVKGLVDSSLPSTLELVRDVSSPLHAHTQTKFRESPFFLDDMSQ